MPIVTVGVKGNHLKYFCGAKPSLCVFVALKPNRKCLTFGFCICIAQLLDIIIILWMRFIWIITTAVSTSLFFQRKFLNVSIYFDYYPFDCYLHSDECEYNCIGVCLFFLYRRRRACDRSFVLCCVPCSIVTHIKMLIFSYQYFSVWCMACNWHRSCVKLMCVSVSVFSFFLFLFIQGIYIYQKEAKQLQRRICFFNKCAKMSDV